MWTTTFITAVRCKMDEFDEDFHALNNYHANIKSTIELSPSKFLDTQLINIGGKYITKVNRKESKIPIHLYTGHQKYQIKEKHH